jgi:hypothetical protein
MKHRMADRCRPGKNHHRRASGQTHLSGASPTVVLCQGINAMRVRNNTSSVRSYILSLHAFTRSKIRMSLHETYRAVKRPLLDSIQIIDGSIGCVPLSRRLASRELRVCSTPTRMTWTRPPAACASPRAQMPTRGPPSAKAGRTQRVRGSQTGKPAHSRWAAHSIQPAHLTLGPPVN